MAPEVETARKRLLRRYKALLRERQDWDLKWRQIAEWVRDIRWQDDSRLKNEPPKASDKIINPRSLLSGRTLVAGFTSGFTSSTRPWFQLHVPGVDLSRVSGAGEWLYREQEATREVLAKSNFYNQAMVFYDDLSNFETAVMIADEDDKDTVRFYVLPPGSYCLATSHRQELDTLYRRSLMTVEQLVDKFGEENVSARVRDMLEQGGHLDEWVEVLHVIEPNKEHVQGDYRPVRRPWLSTWLEVDANEEDGLLRENGYFSKPFAAARWAVHGDNVYGSDGPGSLALGPSKSIQHLEVRKGKLVDKMSDPPMRGPASMMGRTASLLPGAVNYDVDSGPGARFEPALVIQPQSIGEVKDAISQFERQIEQCYYEDLWLHLARMERREMTAREIDKREQEQMWQLGPVVERVQEEFVEVIIERVWDSRLRRGDVAPPPQEMSGLEIKVENISILAGAQKMLEMAGIREWVMFAQGIAQMNPDVMDKIRFDRAMDSTADKIGVPPEIVATDEEVAQIRQARAEAMAEQQQMEQAEAMGRAGRDMSQAKLEDDSIATRVLDQIGGVIGGQAGP